LNEEIKDLEIQKVTIEQLFRMEITDAEKVQNLIKNGT
jgi:hypothetical protein